MVGVGADSQSHGGVDPLEVEARRIVTGVRALVSDMNAIEPGVRVKLAQIAQREFAAVEVSGLAEMKRAGASDRDVERRAAAGGTRSRTASSKQRKRADVVGVNPGLAKKLGDGDLGEEHVDALAEAAAKSGGDGARGSPPRLVWRTRPATPEEITPSRPKAQPKQPKRKPERAAKAQRSAPRRRSAQRGQTPLSPIARE